MSAEQTRAANIRAATDKGRTQNDFGVLKLTAGTTHSSSELPADFNGRWVTILPVGGILHWGVSPNADDEIDSGVTATAAGASDMVGHYIPDGTERHRKLPDWPPGTPFYFVREASATTVIYLALADPP